MSVIFRTVERPSDPRVENSPKKYYPQLVTLGQSVDLAFIAQKMQVSSHLGPSCVPQYILAPLSRI